MKRIMMLCATVALAACGRVDGGPSDDQGGSQQDLGVQPSPASPTKVEQHYALRPDPRLCPSPTCGGWFVRALNLGAAEQYVAQLDWTPSGLDQKSIDTVLATPAERVILSGALVPDAQNLNTLLVTGAWIGLPGVTAAVDTVYSVTVLPLDCATCPTLRANLLNTTKVESAYTLSVKQAARPLVQLDWLENRVFVHGALVSASVGAATSTVADASTIVASQVWLKLPDVRVCNVPKPAPCPAGTIQTFVRDAERCLQASACVKSTGCPLLFSPSCEPGYRLATWPAEPNGCDVAACDPDFVDP